MHRIIQIPLQALLNIVKGVVKMVMNCWQTMSLTHGAEPFLRSRQLCSYSRISQRFMEPEDSLPCSQEPYTGSYLKPDQSNPYHPIISLYDPF
jgi:hypothetical protein